MRKDRGAVSAGSAPYRSSRTVTFADHFEELAQPYFESDEDRASYVEAARLIEAGRTPELRVDLSQVAAMKVLADSVFIKKFRELFEEHVVEQRA